MIQERYCSSEVSKLLKEKGFKEMCSRCWGISVRHNGKEIDEDEEYDLKSKGKENEIEYVDGGCLYNMNDDNSLSPFVYACPTQQSAIDWLSATYHIEISIKPKGIREVGDNQYKNCYSAIVYKPNKANIIGWDSEYIRIVNMLKSGTEDFNEFDTKKEAIDEALKFSLKYLI